MESEFRGPLCKGPLNRLQDSAPGEERPDRETLVSSCVVSRSRFPAVKELPQASVSGRAPELDGCWPGQSGTGIQRSRHCIGRCGRSWLGSSEGATHQHAVDVGLGHQQVDVVGLTDRRNARQLPGNFGQAYSLIQPARASSR